MTGLTSQIVTSTAWFAATRLWMQGLSWAATLILARLLTPADYGLFAMALGAIAFLELFREFGLGTAIIQRQNLGTRTLNTIFWLVAGTSLLLFCIASVGAPVVAAYYKDARLTDLIRILALISLLNAVGTVPYSLLTKEIDFKKRSLAEAFGVIGSVLISLGMAYSGYGVTALVGGQLARSAITNIMMLVSCGWKPGFELAFSGMAGILTFSVRVAGASIVTRLPTIATPVILGRTLGDNALGFYTMADSLGNNPFHRLSTQVINQLSLPVFSKLQNDTALLVRYYLKITKYLAMIGLPMQVGMFLVAHDLVDVLLGSKWIAAVPLVCAFAVSGVFYILPLPSAPLLTARGKAQLNLRFSWVFAATTVCALIIGSRFSLVSAAVAWAVAFSVTRIFLLLLGLREIQLSLISYIRNILSPMVATACMAASVLFSTVLIPYSFNAPYRLTIVVVSGVIAYSGALLLLERPLLGELRYIVRSLAGQT